MRGRAGWLRCIPLDAREAAADVPTSSATATTSASATPTASVTPTTAAVAAGVGYGSGADEAVASRAVRATRRAITQRAAPKPATTTKPPAKKTTEQKAASAYYKNCAAVRAAGAAPIHRGEPGYSTKLDGDGDGVACET